MCRLVVVLLYILPVKLLGANDGGVSTWQLMAQLTGRKDFVYVADCKKRDHRTDA